MRHADYSARAAAIVDDIIGRSGGDLGPENRDPLRVVVRIAFEVQDFLATQASDKEALSWTQDTVFSGCESINLARLAWWPALDDHRDPGQPEFATDMSDLARRLDEALGILGSESAPWSERVLAVNHVARVQLAFLGATLW